MAQLKERDVMECRSCGREERASEGYPCASCGTFICLMCVLRGVTRCAACRQLEAAESGGTSEGERLLDWPEH